MAMVGKNFPVSEYYRNNIIDAVSISRSGNWWTAVLLINDPSSKKPFISLYRWQNTSSGWKVRKRFSFRRLKEAKSIIEIVNKFCDKLPIL